MRDDIDYMLHVIEREGGWRAFALNLVTMLALCAVLYAVTVTAYGVMA